MGQYHYPVNLTKLEYINPHKLDCGLKAWEQLANSPCTAAALIALLVAPEPRGGGDLSVDTPEAKRVVGRWHGDRIALIGDYAEDGDIPDWTGDPLSTIYNRCGDGTYTDISEDVAAVLKDELAEIV